MKTADETQIGGSSPRPARLGLRPLGVVGVGALLAILALQLALTASHNSITWDEDDHIYAGYMSWRHADFGLNPEHPPLVKQLAALPLLNLPLKMPVLQNRFFKLEAFLGGKDFLFQNDADTVLLRARMAAALLTILLSLLVLLAAREMFGAGAGFIALTLLVFDPNLLAHGAVVGTDVGLSCFMFAAVVFPMLFLLALTDLLCKTRPRFDSVTGTKGRLALRLVVAPVAIAAISIATLWAFYGFRYRARAEGYELNPPLSQFVQGLSRPREVRLLETVARFRVLPESYLYGLADVRTMSDFYTSYLFGTV